MIRFEPGVSAEEGWKAQTNPLSYGSLHPPTKHMQSWLEWANIGAYLCYVPKIPTCLPMLLNGNPNFMFHLISSPLLFLSYGSFL